MIIGWIPAVAGGGATSLMLATATRLAARGQRVAIIDADPLAELSRRLRLRPARPLDDIFRWNETEARRAIALHVAQNVVLVPADPGRFAGSGVACSPAALAACARTLLKDADCVLLDLPPAGSPATATALALVDAFIAVTPATAAGVGALPALLRLALASRRGVGASPRLLALATGPVRSGDASAPIAQRLAAACDPDAFCAEVPYDEAVERAALAGYAAVDAPSNLFVTALSSLATAVLSSLPRTAGHAPESAPSEVPYKKGPAPTATAIFAAGF